jgi:predicted AAA+ superfamily ATPase
LVATFFQDDVEIIVTGSGRLDVYQKGGDSLLGRYLLHRLHPFTVGEVLAGGRQDVITPEQLDDCLGATDLLAVAGEALAQIERFTGFPRAPVRRPRRPAADEAKVYLFDFTEIDAAGDRFENVVALHLLKLVDARNDRGHGDFALWYVRDKERREVDFLITDRRRPYLLLEAKLAEEQPTPALRYFRDRLRPRHAVQLVREGTPRRVDGVHVLPADRLLCWM